MSVWKFKSNPHMLLLFSLFVAIFEVSHMVENGIPVAKWGFYDEDMIASMTFEELQLEDELCINSQFGDSILDCQHKIQNLFRYFLKINLSSSGKARNEAQTRESLESPRSKLKFTSDKFPLSSTLKIGAKNTVPWPQIWSYCHWCSMQYGKVVLHDPEHSLQDALEGTSSQPVPGEKKAVLMSQSKWHGFFYERPGQFWAEFSDDPFELGRCKLVVDKPAFAFRILTWQVGHLVVDVLEPLYHTMMAVFGNINTDVYLFLDVAGKPEGSVIFRKMLTTSSGDTPFALLRNFTNHPIYTIGALSQLEGPICFTEGLHLGLDISHSYYAHGFDFHPSVANLDRSADREIARRYKLFRRFILKSLGQNSYYEDTSQLLEVQSSGIGSIHHLYRTPADLNVTYIQRTGPRALNNDKELVSVMNGKGPGVFIAALEDLTFSEQLQLFSSSSIFVSQYGSGAHNVVFLPPGAVLILLVQPGWCDWAWVYANQAVFSDVHVFVHCDEPAPEGVYHFRWHHKGWLQGPFETKYTSHSVDVEVFESIFVEALKLFLGNQVRVAVKPAVHAVRYKRHSTRKSLLLDLDYCNEEAGTDVPAWIHLGPVDIEEGPHGTKTFKVIPSIYSTLAPAKLMRQYPGLTMCFQEITTGVGSCHRSEDFNEYSTIDIAVTTTELLVLTAWLERHDTKEAIPSSFTLLPLNHRHNWTYIGAGNFSIDHHYTINLDVFVDGKPAQFEVQLGEEGMLQKSLCCFCRSQKLDVDECAKLAIQAYNALGLEFDRLAETLPAIQSFPTAKNPFIFFHLEKVGGTTLRSMIVQAAKKHGLKIFAPCYTHDFVYDISLCNQFGLGKVDHFRRQKLEVIAAHLDWKQWQELPSISTEKDFSCFVMLRHPVSRIISYYYERLYGSATNKSMNELLPSEFEEMMSSYGVSVLTGGSMVVKDEGMVNAGCKMLCGAYNYAGTYFDPELNSTDFLRSDVNKLKYSVKQAQTNLKKCTVGILERWEETKLILGHWFPWMIYESDEKRHVLHREGRETRATLNPQLQKVIASYNQCDLELYERGLLIFQQQVEIISSQT